ncbi:hypothetical protein [Plantibacter sp. ME-Dv--P-095]|uniref:hypothetical protein n=1 Tax=Plantibacter sp. ME-Dv--P-095 TaxID=3040299 RepID=UPI00254F892B|nr:hypothetical protein [Plantibacter sp. ME-Dv--P-095]
MLVLVTVEGLLLWQWIASGQARTFFAADDWAAQLLPTFGGWALANLLSGVLLVPVAMSRHRRRILALVRNRRIPDVLMQTRIEQARKRADDLLSAASVGVTLDAETGRITGTTEDATTAPLQTGDHQAFGIVRRATVKNLAERFYDARRVPDWINDDGRLIVLPKSAAAVRALLLAESGTGKTVLLDDAILCALKYGWPVVFIDAKGDPDDAEKLAKLAAFQGHTASVGGGWDLFNGSADQVTAKLMRLMPVADGANQHYLDEVRGVLQAVQDQTSISSVEDLRERLLRPMDHVRDQYDLQMVNHKVDRDGTTAGQRALQSLLVALRPLERWLDDEGWSYGSPRADLTIVPLSPVDDAQARLGDLLLMDLRNYLSTRLERRDKSPMLLIVDEFPQLVTGTSDPGDTAGSLFETARSAGVGLILAAQSTAGVSNDEVRRRRALSSGAALIFGRSKDPEDVVKFAGTVMQMEASGAAGGEELRSARAQHTYVVPPQDVREASAGSFWIVQGGAIAPFRALPPRTIPKDTAETSDPDEPVDEAAEGDVEAKAGPAE